MKRIGFNSNILDIINNVLGNYKSCFTVVREDCSKKRRDFTKTLRISTNIHTEENENHKI